MKNKKQILITTTGSISKDDKAILKAENILVIEVDDVAKIKTISGLNVIGTDEVVSIAIKTMNDYSTNTSLRSLFGDALLKTISSRLSAANAKP